MIVTDGTTTTVVWASHADVIEGTALYTGDLTAAQLTAANDMLASSTLAKCKLKVWQPWASGSNVRTKSTQRCWGSLLDTHESWLDLEQYSNVQGWTLVADDDGSARSGRTIRLDILKACRDEYTSGNYRAIGGGLMYLTNGDTIDVGPIRPSPRRIGCSTW